MYASEALWIAPAGAVRQLPATRRTCAGLAGARSDDRPREEQRIVTFIDLVDSTGIAERLGSVRFHALLADVLSRLSFVVAEFGGEVHRYVGDALIATWPLGRPQENARAIRCLFACREALEAAGSAMMRRHGLIPKFRASIHCGPLVAAEIGGARREIALVGDAMNTAARIEEACRATGHSVLVSQALLARSAMPAGIAATSVGSRVLRGKAERLELFALEAEAHASFEMQAA
ncbi:MAG: adenylate/guanylate cyclase domain-containing protein [Propylenella sp.]